jgi:hypothetical protein
LWRHRAETIINK